MTQVNVSSATSRAMTGDKGSFLAKLETENPDKYKALEMLVSDLSKGSITPVFSGSSQKSKESPKSNIVHDFFYKSPQGLKMGLQDIASLVGIAVDWIGMSTSQRYGPEGKQWQDKYTQPAIDAVVQLAPVVARQMKMEAWAPGVAFPGTKSLAERQQYYSGAKEERSQIAGALAEGLREEVGERGAFGLVHPAEIAVGPFVPKMSRAAKTIIGDVRAGVPDPDISAAGLSSARDVEGLLGDYPVLPERRGGAPGPGEGDEGPTGPSDDIKDLLKKTKDIRKTREERVKEAIEEDNRSFDEAVGEPPKDPADWQGYVVKRDKWLRQKGERDKRKNSAKYSAMVAAIGEHPGVTTVSPTREETWEYNRSSILWQIENGYLDPDANPLERMEYKDYLGYDALDTIGIPRQDRMYKRLGDQEFAFFDRLFKDEFIREDLLSKAPNTTLFGGTLVYDGNNFNAISAFLDDFEYSYPGTSEPKPPRSLIRRDQSDVSGLIRSLEFGSNTRTHQEEVDFVASRMPSRPSAGGELPITAIPGTSSPDLEPRYNRDFERAARGFPVSGWAHASIAAGGRGGTSGRGNLSVGGRSSLLGEYIQGEGTSTGPNIVSDVEWPIEALDLRTILNPDLEPGIRDDFLEEYKEDYLRILDELDQARAEDIASKQNPYDPVGRMLSDKRQRLRELLLIDYPAIGEHLGLTLDNSFDVLTKVSGGMNNPGHVGEALDFLIGSAVEDFKDGIIREIRDPIRLQREIISNLDGGALRRFADSVRRQVDKYNDEGPRAVLSGSDYRQEEPSTRLPAESPEETLQRASGTPPQNYTMIDVMGALEAEDVLGFDTAEQAGNAILSHPDWEDRWEIVDPENLEILRQYYAGRISSEEGSSSPSPSATNLQRMADVISDYVSSEIPSTLIDRLWAVFMPSDNPINNALDNIRLRVRDGEPITVDVLSDMIDELERDRAGEDAEGLQSSAALGVTESADIRRDWLDAVAQRLSEHGTMSIRDAQNGLISISVEAQDRLIDALARGADTGQQTTPQELFDILNDAYRSRDYWWRAGMSRSHESMGQADIEPPEELGRPLSEMTEEEIRDLRLNEVAERLSEHPSAGTSSANLGISAHMTSDEIRSYLEDFSLEEQDRLIDAYLQGNTTGAPVTPQELSAILFDLEAQGSIGQRDIGEDPVAQSQTTLDDMYQRDARRNASLVSDWMASDEHVDLVGPTITDAGIHEFGRHPVEGPLQEIDWASGATTQREYVSFWDQIPEVENLDAAMPRWNDIALNNLMQYVSTFIDFPGVTDMAPNYPTDSRAYAKVNQDFIKNNQDWDSKLLGADEEGYGLGFGDLSETWGEGEEQVKNRAKAVSVINEWRRRQLGGNDF